MTNKRFIALPLIDAETELIHAIKGEINGETAYGFETMTAAEYAKQFDVSILPNGWPSSMSVLDMALSLEGIDKECADYLLETLYGGDDRD